MSQIKIFESMNSLQSHAFWHWTGVMPS